MIIRSIFYITIIFIGFPTIVYGDTVHIENSGVEVKIKTNTRSDSNDGHASSSVKNSVRSSSSGESTVKIDTYTEANGIQKEYHFQESGENIRESFINEQESDDGSAHVETSVDVLTNKITELNTDESQNNDHLPDDPANANTKRSFHQTALSFIKQSFSQLINAFTSLF